MFIEGDALVAAQALDGVAIGAIMMALHGCTPRSPKWSLRYPLLASKGMRIPQPALPVNVFDWYPAALEAWYCPDRFVG